MRHQISLFDNNQSFKYFNPLFPPPKKRKKNALSTTYGQNNNNNNNKNVFLFKQTYCKYTLKIKY